MTTAEPHTTMAHDKDFWSLPHEEAVSLLMQKYNISRERAEAILQRDPTDVRRHPMIPVTHEELDRLLEKIARSGENMFIGGKSESVDEEQEGS